VIICLLDDIFHILLNIYSYYSFVLGYMFNLTITYHGCCRRCTSQCYAPTCDLCRGRDRLCIKFPTSGWHTFLNFTAWYVFYLEDLTVKESMMAYRYELVNRTNTCGWQSMEAFDRDMREYGTMASPPQTSYGAYVI